MITPLENIQRYTQQAVSGGLQQPQQQQQQVPSAAGTPTTNGHAVPFIPTSSGMFPLYLSF